jgi:tRNA(Ile)-lysidine synthase
MKATFTHPTFTLMWVLPVPARRRSPAERRQEVRNALKGVTQPVPGSLQEFVANLAQRYSSSKGRVGVAVSGGADSVFLLHALHEAGLAGQVLHVNHQLRGSESDGDEGFVRGLAAQLGVPCSVATLPPGPGNTEQEARRGRYTWFSACITSGVCDLVATGHTLDDQAETVLSRFLRGAGTAGLAGILPATSAGIMRPLLRVPRATVRAWMLERHFEWREDSSNLDPSFLRNRLRRDVMPLLTSINPGLPATLGATAEWARGEESYWAAEVERLANSYIQQRGEVVLLEASRVNDLHVAAQRRLLRRTIELVRGDLRSIDFRHVEAIRQLSASIKGSGRLQLPGLDIFRSFDWLRISPHGFDARSARDFEIDLPVPGSAVVAEKGLQVVTKLGAGNHVYNSELHAIDPARLTGSLLLRNWRPGDSLSPRGSTRAEKIKTLFQEHRIPVWERRAWPVIAAGRSVVWTRRFGVSAEYAAGPDSRSVILVRDVMESIGLSTASNGMKGSEASFRDAHRGTREGAEVL